MLTQTSADNPLRFDDLTRGYSQRKRGGGDARPLGGRWRGYIKSLPEALRGRANDPEAGHNAVAPTWGAPRHLPLSHGSLLSV